jgi:ABC-2 type transport system permease protein
MKKLNILKSRRFKHGSMATILTIGFIVVVVVINIIANLILERFPADVDLTDDGIYQLTEDSIEFVKDLNTDVNIHVCVSESDFISAASSSTYYKQAYEILNGYTKYNGNIKVDYVDLMEEPEFQQKYTGYDVSDGSIVVESDKRIKVTTINDLFNTSTDYTTGSYNVSSKAEQVLTSAIMYVTDDEVMQATILTGHSETAVDGFTSILTANNFETVTQNIATEEINPDATIAVIYAPTTDYTQAELEKLDAFLDNDGKFGKTLIYIASINQPELPNLEEFLTEWGIQIGSGVLYETNTANAYGNQFVMGLDYTNTDYTADLRDASLPFIGSYCRPVSTLWEESSNRTTSVLLSTPETAILVPYDADENFDINAQEQKSFPVAVLGQRSRFEGTTQISSNVLVFSAPEMFNSSITSSATFNNNEYTVNLVNQLAGKEESINIVEVSFDQEALTITQSQYMTCTVIFMFILPIAMIVCGIVIWVLRRNK